MVDREIFSRRLEALHGYLQKLKAFREAEEEEFVREPALHDLAERYLHLAVEACLDLANHWISDRALPTPDANRDTLHHVGACVRASSGAGGEAARVGGFSKHLGARVTGD